jgi:hypothetical protein
VDIIIRDGINSQEALIQAKDRADQSMEAMEALEAAAKQGFSNGAFEETENEGIEVVEEFYPVQQEDQQVEDLPALTAMETRRVG